MLTWCSGTTLYFFVFENGKKNGRFLSDSTVLSGALLQKVVQLVFLQLKHFVESRMAVGSRVEIFYRFFCFLAIIIYRKYCAVGVW